MAGQESSTASRICKSCGVEKLLTLFKKGTRLCKSCDSIRAIAWGKNHRQQKAATNSRWEKRNPESGKKRSRKSVEKNKEIRNERRRKRRGKDPQKHLQENRDYKARNPEKWRLYRLMQGAAYRARKRNALLNDLTAAQWQEIKQAYGHKCVYCGRKMKRLTQDHIIPLSKGGNHTASNVVPACQSCNSKKGARAPLRPVQPLLLTVAMPKPYLPIARRLA